MRFAWLVGWCNLSSKGGPGEAQSPYRFDHSHVIFRLAGFKIALSLLELSRDTSFLAAWPDRDQPFVNKTGQYGLTALNAGKSQAGRSVHTWRMNFLVFFFDSQTLRSIICEPMLSDMVAMENQTAFHPARLWVWGRAWFLETRLLIYTVQLEDDFLSASQQMRPEAEHHLHITRPAWQKV